jgi:hypothetical protein
MTTNLSTYRVRTLSRKVDVPTNYRGTFEILDEHSQQVMAYCDLLGHATFSSVLIIDKDNKTWTMKPNRKILPTRWILSGQNQSLAMQFDRNFSHKLKNPIYKVILSLLDSQDKEIYRIVDPRGELVDRVLGVGPDEWLIMEGDEVVARISTLVRHKEQPTNLWQKIKSFLTPTDKGIVSLKGSHVLSAPIGLAMLLILHELTASK